MISRNDEPPDMDEPEVDARDQAEHALGRSESIRKRGRENGLGVGEKEEVAEALFSIAAAAWSIVSTLEHIDESIRYHRAPARRIKR